MVTASQASPESVGRTTRPRQLQQPEQAIPLAAVFGLSLGDTLAPHVAGRVCATAGERHSIVDDAHECSERGLLPP